VEKERSKGERGVEICPSVCPERSKGEEAWGEKVGNTFLVHTNSNSSKREKVCHLRDLCMYDVVRREGVKKETLRNIKFATLCRA
jgi:hypothetical protein